MTVVLYTVNMIGEASNRIEGIVATNARLRPEGDYLAIILPADLVLPDMFTDNLVVG